MVGLHSGRIEYALVAPNGPSPDSAPRPVPFELLTPSENGLGFDLLADEEQVRQAPNGGPDWNYMTCAKIYNHYGLFY